MCGEKVPVCFCARRCGESKLLIFNLAFLQLDSNPNGIEK